MSGIKYLQSGNKFRVINLPLYINQDKNDSDHCWTIYSRVMRQNEK